MLHSIRWKLTASYILLAVLTAGAIGIAAMKIVGEYARRQELTDLQETAKAIASQAFPLMQPAIHVDELARLARTSAFLGDVRVRILDHGGEVIADSGEPQAGQAMVWVAPPANPPGLAPAEDAPWEIIILGSYNSADLKRMRAAPFSGAPGEVDFTIIRRVGGPWGSRLTFETILPAETFKPEERVLGVRTPPRSQTRLSYPVGPAEDPFGYIELGAAPGFAVEAQAATRQALLLAGGGAIVLAVIIGLAISKRLTSPILALGDVARRMEAGDLSARAEIRARDEIGALATRFNQMAEGLETSFRQLEADRDAMRRFIADASHELRTPITALKNFYTLLSGAAARDRKAQQEFLRESSAQLDRLEWITQNLLDLSRLDAGLVEMDLEEHDLDEALQACYSAFKRLAEEKGIDLTLQAAPTPVRLVCDRQRLEIAITNLLDNAIKFTPEGGRVSLGAQQEGGLLRLWVQDSGPGISPEEQEHIFERFYRGRQHTQSGSGLGLSIVESLVRAQGGRVRVESEPGQGARFILEWEVARA